MLCLSGLKLIAGVCYRSPSSTSENDEALLSLFKSVGDFDGKHNCIIMGDFNLPNIDFGASTVHGAEDSFAAKVYDCPLDNFWTQHVTD